MSSVETVSWFITGIVVLHRHLRQDNVPWSLLFAVRARKIRNLAVIFTESCLLSFRFVANYCLSCWLESSLALLPAE